MSARAASALRSGAGVLRLPGRALVSASGDDRVRWLNGMVTNDVEALRADGSPAHCAALLLTRQGRLVADLRIVAESERLLLDAPAAAVPALMLQLDTLIIADDVELASCDELARLVVVGPAAPAWLGRIDESAGEALPAGAALHLSLAGAPVVVAEWPEAGLPARQLIAPSGSLEALEAALAEVAPPEAETAEVEAGLELIRIEAGLPRWGAELGPDVLPAEAGLDAAISETKGCYTGQEVVARMRSRGRMSHRLVGLVFPEGQVKPGTALEKDAREVGEVTSVVESPVHGWIGLGFVRAAEAEPGSPLRAAGCEAVTAEIPFA